MHLLHCSLIADSDRLNINLCEFAPGEVEYAILSHRWGRAEDEVSYHDLTEGTYRQKKGYEKIEACCREALQDGLSYVWIDTCCIDKSSSSELSEAINSMYEWYKQSTICYAYLQDVQSDEDYSHPNSSFRSSQWFTRGWTLQEMVAPSDVIFYAGDWNKIGRRSQLAKLLHDVTRVTKSVLLRPRQFHPQACISQIMYWASGRRTTRKEDRAYSLLGLFGINMPILYGEGNSAFMRLQEELLRVRYDQTIFAWNLQSPCSGLLADSPDAFKYSGKVKKLPVNYYTSGGKPSEFSYTLSSLGIEMKLPYCKLYGRLDLYAVYIGCFINTVENRLCLLLKRYYGGLEDQYFRTRLSTGSVSDEQSSFPCDSKKVKKKVFWIVQPEIDLRKTILPLAQGNSTEERGYDKIKIEYFWIKVELITRTIRPVIQARYPMPNLRFRYVAENSSFHNGIKMETEAGVVWLSSIFSNGYMRESHGKINVLLAVIDKELVCHMELNIDSQDTSHGIYKFFERCKRSSDRPCTLIDRLPAHKELPDITNTIIYMKKSTVFRCLDQIKCFKVKIRFAKKRNDAKFKRIQNKWEKTAPSKSLKELLAKCKPIFTNHEYSYNSYLFQYALRKGNPSEDDSYDF